MNVPISRKSAQAFRLAALCLLGTVADCALGAEAATVTIPAMADTYLESDGTQAIDTGYRASGKTKVVVDFECADTNNTRYVFGSVSGNFPFSLGLYFQAGRNISIGMGDAANASVYKNFGSAAPLTKSRYTATLDCESGAATLSGAGKTVSVDLSSQLRTATNDISLAVFARHVADDYDSRFVGKIYSMQIYDGGELVRDFVPYAYGAATGLLDRVNGVVHENVRAGGNAFGFGTDAAFALGSSARPVYVDTEFTPDCNTKVEFDFALCSTNSGPRPFGVIATSGLCWGMYVTAAGEIAYTVRSKNNNGATTQVKADGRRRILVLDGPGNSAVLKTPSGSVHFEGTLSQKPSANESAAKSLVVFGGNAASGFSNAADVKVYGMKIWDDGTLVRDFSPRVVDGVAGLWDAQNSKFYTPKSAYRLTVGGDVECATEGGIGAAASADAYLEAAEAGPVLDTGCKFSSASRIVIDYAYVTTNTAASASDRDTYFALDARSGTSAPSLGIYKQDGVQKLRYWDGSANKFDNTSKPLTYYRQQFTVDVPARSAALSQNGTGVATLSPAFPASFVSGASIVIFGRRTDDGTGVQDPQPLRVYGLKIYEKQPDESYALVRDFAPAMRDGEAGLYDPLTGDFRGNVNASETAQFRVHGGGTGGRGLVFEKDPEGGTIPVNGTLTLSAYAPGAIGCLWLLDGKPVEGATGPELEVEWENRASSVRNYSCLALYAVRGYAESAVAVVQNAPSAFVLVVR
ncbi:MAG: hypothetical protein IJ678_04035 [Kiritimatiellae bacterium]|nr:hypothetical protein [Kiritimatiellia bacterium]